MKGTVLLLLSNALAFVICAKTMDGDDITSSSKLFLTKGQYNLTCNYKTVNALLPVTYAWYKDNQLLPDNKTKSILFNDPVVDDTKGKYTCTVTREGETVTSKAIDIDVFPLTAIPTFYQSVNVVGHYAVQLIGQRYTFSCDGDFSTPGMVYEWRVDNIVQTNQVSKTFQYTPKAPGDVEIKCKYSYEGQTSKQGKLLIEPTYIDDVSLLLHNNGVTDISPVEGSKVRIECVVSPSEISSTASFSWSVDSSPVKSESPRHYEFTAGKAGSPKTTITCQVDVKGTSKKTSVRVTPTKTPLKGKVRFNFVLIMGAKGDLSCTSNSYAEGATFTWRKDNVVIQGATGYLYHISKLSKSDEGSYTCTITVKGKTSSISYPKQLRIAPDEIPCEFASDCKRVPHTDTMICDDGKCRCLEGYGVKNQQCSNGAVIMGSFVMVLSVLLTQNLL